MAENLHTALAYWQGNRPRDAFKLWKSTILESMYLGSSPGNFQQISFYDTHRGELYRDFADPIGMAARSLVEGLFGIRPNLLKDTLTINPGLPELWNHASLLIPDVKFYFRRQRQVDSYTIKPSLNKLYNLKLQVAARSVSITSVTLNNKPVKWTAVKNVVGEPLLQIVAGARKVYQFKITWGTQKPEPVEPVNRVVVKSVFKKTYNKARVIEVNDPQHVLYGSFISNNHIKATIANTYGNHTFFLKLKQGSFTWWHPVNLNIVAPITITADTQQAGNLSQFKVISNNGAKAISVVINPELRTAYRKSLVIRHKGQPAIFTVPGNYLIPGSNHVLMSDGKYIVDTALISWNSKGLIQGKSHHVDLRAYFNDRLTQIFKNKYVSPRPKSPTLQLPWQGIGNWAYPLVTANIDDSGLKRLAGKGNGLFKLPNQITFATPVDDSKNILFTSRWDNYQAKQQFHYQVGQHMLICLWRAQLTLCKPVLPMQK